MTMERSLVRVMFHLEIDDHSIVRDFPACFTHGAMFGAFFVKDGVGVVDVIVDFARAGDFRQSFESAAGAGDGNVAHAAGEFSTAAGADEFVVGPERAVYEDGVELVPIG